MSDLRPVPDELVTRDAVDTAVYRPGTDTVATVTADTIGVCQQAFGGATDEPTEVLNLARLQLYTAQDEAATAHGDDGEAHPRGARLGAVPDRR